MFLQTLKVSKKKKVKPPTKKGGKKKNKREMKDTQNRNKGEITRKTGNKGYSSDDEECFCLICIEPFSNSLPREKYPVHFMQRLGAR